MPGPRGRLTSGWAARFPFRAATGGLPSAHAPHRLLPGAGGRAAFWRPVAERLADLGPAHLLGYPGFGDAPADPAVRSLGDLYAWVLARLPPGACHLVAQSMGGVLAARLAVEQPARVARLVLVAATRTVLANGLGLLGVSAPERM